MGTSAVERKNQMQHHGAVVTTPLQYLAFGVVGPTANVDRQKSPACNVAACYAGLFFAKSYLCSP